MARRTTETSPSHQMKLRLVWPDDVQGTLQTPETVVQTAQEKQKVSGQLKEGSIIYINNTQYGWKILENIAVERVTQAGAGKLASYKVTKSGKMYRDGQYRTLAVDKIVFAYAAAFKQQK